MSRPGIRNEWSPLHSAASGNSDPTVVELLIAEGADVGSRGSVVSTPLMVAISGDNTPAVMEVLLDHGADFSDATFVWSGWHEDPAVMSLLLDRGANILAKNENNKTILHTAMEHHEFETIQLLIERGADILCHG